eukprot:gene17462-biopygen4256
MAPDEKRPVEHSTHQKPRGQTQIRLRRNALGALAYVEDGGRGMSGARRGGAVGADGAHRGERRETAVRTEGGDDPLLLGDDAGADRDLSRLERSARRMRLLRLHRLGPCSCWARFNPLNRPDHLKVISSSNKEGGAGETGDPREPARGQEWGKH